VSKKMVSIESGYLEFLQTSFPDFWKAKIGLKRLNSLKNLREFYEFILKFDDVSHSQLYQDVFVTFIFEEARELNALEFGATDGVSLSNTLMLEKEFDWSCVLVEPDPQWANNLVRNRPSAVIDTRCVWSTTGEQLEFVQRSVGEFSHLSGYGSPVVEQVASDGSARCSVETVSLNDLCEEYFLNKSLDFLSVDTEGSELAVLERFDFERFHPGVVVVEHNFVEDVQPRLQRLLESQGYVLIFPQLTVFDAWYVRNDLARCRGFD